VVGLPLWRRGASRGSPVPEGTLPGGLARAPPPGAEGGAGGPPGEKGKKEKGKKGKVPELVGAGVVVATAHASLIPGTGTECI